MEVDEENSDRSEILKRVVSFKDLRKPTISETYENVRKLIGKNEVENYGNIRKLVLAETQVPLFDECLKLTLIDCLKLENEVVKILLSQNDQEIKRILGCKWFFRVLPFSFCTTEIFPHVSVSVRCKIITKLSKHLQSEQEAEKYFMFVRKNYESHRAEYLLPRCSEQFILNHFKNHKSMVQNLRILSLICKRYPEVGLEMLNYDFEQKNNLYDLKHYGQLLRYFAGNHIHLFVPFLKKHHHLMDNRVFGRKITKKLGTKLRKEFHSNEIGGRPFKFKLLFPSFPHDVKVKFLADYLRHEDDRLKWDFVSYRACDVLYSVAAKDRLEIIESLIQQLYKVNFNSNSLYWTCNLLEILPLETRKPYVLSIEKNFDPEVKIYDRTYTEFRIRKPEHYIYLLDFKTAFERYKPNILRSKVAKAKIEILEELVKNCRINSDFEGLQEVVDFVGSHFRHDDRKIVDSFIRSVLRNFNWKKLTPLTYQRLEELFHLCSLNGTVDSGLYKLWHEKCIFYLMENGRDVKEKIKNYFENGILKNSYDTLLEDYNSHHSKTLLVALGTLALEWVRSNSDKANSLIMSLVRTCEHCPRAWKTCDIWSEIPGLNELLIEKLRAKYKDVGGEQWSLDVWRRYPKDVERTQCDPRCVQYVLKKRPDFVQTHLEGILNTLLSTYNDRDTRKSYKSCFHYVLRLASFFGLTEKVKEFLLREFKTGSPVEKRNMALLMYSEMSTIEEFTNVVHEYIPKQDKIEAEPGVEFGKIQLLIPSLIVHVRPRWKNFDLIFKFYMGDFLKRVKPTLHACCIYTRVDIVIPFLKKQLEILSEKVSHRKDIIKLIMELSTREERLRFCVEFWDQYQHYSMRSLLFNFLSKLFREQPSRESYRIVEKFVLESDNLTISKRPNLESIPVEFLTEYVDVLLKFSEKQEPSLRDDLQNSVLSHFASPKIKLLSSEFCVNLLKNNLFRPGSNLKLDEFSYFYMKEGPGALADRVKLIFNCAHENNVSPGYLSFILENLMEKSLGKPVAFADLFQVVLENWPKYPTGILYHERVLFIHHILYQKTLQKSLSVEQTESEFAKELNQQYHSVENLTDVVVVYADALKKFLKIFDVMKGISIIKNLLKEATDRAVGVLAAMALPKEAKEWYLMNDNPLDELVAKRKKIAKELYEAFETKGDEIVLIYLRRKLYAGE